MPPGPRKEPVYTFFSLKSPGRRTPPPGSPTGPLWREITVYRAFCISLKKPHLLCSPVKEPSPKIPFMEPLIEKCPATTALLHSPTKVAGIRAPSSRREMPASRDFPNISSRFPSEGPPPEAPSPGHPQRETPHPRAPFIQLSKSPVDEPSTIFPKRGPYEERCPSPEPFLHILQRPQRGSPPSRFPSQSSHRERHSTSRATFNHISKSPVDGLITGCSTEPLSIPRAFIS